MSAAGSGTWPSPATAATEPNCAWDALAIVRLLDLDDARVLEHGGRARESRVLRIAAGELRERDGVVSFPLPAQRWWEDIVFT
jgi:hypothetical protein